MHRRLSITLAAVVAAGALSLNQGPTTWAAEDEKPAAQAKGSTSDAPAIPAAPAFPAGVAVDDDPEEERAGLFKTFASASEAILTKGGFDDFVERLVDQDRNRIGEDGFAEKRFAELDAKADAIRAAWKEKFGEDLKLDQEAFAKLAVAVGKIDDAKALAAAWPVAPLVEGATDEPGEPVAASAKETEGNQDPDLNSNLEKGRGVAIAELPQSHGLPAVRVSLIQELTGPWRIDVPNRLTGQQLHDSLLRHLTHVADAQAEWPADKNEAALLIAHHVLLGAYGVDVEPAAGRDAGGAAEGDKAK